MDELTASIAKVQDRWTMVEKSLRGGYFPLLEEQEVARNLSWSLYYLALVLNFGVIIFFPFYSFVSCIVGGIFGGWALGHSTEIRVSGRICEMKSRMFHSSNPIVELDTTIGAIRFMWEYDTLPWSRKVADLIILSPLQWPFSISELRLLHQHSTLQ